MKLSSIEALCCFQFFFRRFICFIKTLIESNAGRQQTSLFRTHRIRDKSQHLLLNFHDTLKLSLLVINGANNVQAEMGKAN